MTRVTENYLQGKKKKKKEKKRTGQPQEKGTVICERSPEKKELLRGPGVWQTKNFRQDVGLQRWVCKKYSPEGS